MKSKNIRWIFSIMVIGSLLMMTFGCQKDVTTENPDDNIDTLNTTDGAVFNPNITYGTLKDTTGHVYKTVTIGTQTWMAENLVTTKYRNGDPIPNVADNAAWSTLTTGAYCDFVYTNSTKFYGRLYNWAAVNDSRNLAPSGWHVATFKEYETLIDYLGGTWVAGGKLKSLNSWAYPNTGATNETGFSALALGYLSAGFGGIGSSGAWWTSTEYSTTEAYYLDMGYNYASASAGYTSKKLNGFSVRLIQDAQVVTSAVSNITQTGAICGGNIVRDNGQAVTARGVCWSINPIPTITDNKTTDAAGIGSYTSTINGLSAFTVYYVRAYATSSNGTVYGDVVSFKTALAIETGTVSDFEGTVYKTVKIGTQWWMAENLKSTKYRNGDLIPNVSDNTLWKNSTTGACCDFAAIPGNSVILGKLYNRFAIMDSRNLAPTGWHVATDAEWTTLIDYLGGQSVAGEKLREVGNTHWEVVNTGVPNNESSFTALPGGYRTDNASFTGAYRYASWWIYDVSNINSLNLSYYCSISKTASLNNYGLSVRCVKD
jgi:uncharacterized protein (TIGR02145 family)